MSSFGPYRSTGSNASFRSEPYRSLGLPRSGESYKTFDGFDDSDELARHVANYMKIHPAEPEAEPSLTQNEPTTSGPFPSNTSQKTSEDAEELELWTQEFMRKNPIKDEPVEPATPQTGDGEWTVVDLTGEEMQVDPETTQASRMQMSAQAVLSNESLMGSAISPGAMVGMQQPPQMCMPAPIYQFQPNIPTVFMPVPVPIAVFCGSISTCDSFTTSSQVCPASSDPLGQGAGSSGESGSENNVIGVPTFKTLPPATEENWEARIEKRNEGLGNLEKSEVYVENQDIPVSGRPVRPNPEDRNLSKRDWESSIAKYRFAWRLIHNSRKLVKMGFEKDRAESAWIEASKLYNATQAREIFDEAVRILRVQMLTQMGFSKKCAARALKKAEGNVNRAAEILLK